MKSGELDARADTLGDRPCRVGSRSRQDEREFVTTGTREQISLADRCADRTHRLNEDRVAGEMAERIVDVFEAVEVDDCQRDRERLLLVDIGQTKITILTSEAAGEIIAQRAPSVAIIHGGPERESS